jgi:hypothetical protein
MSGTKKVVLLGSAAFIAVRFSSINQDKLLDLFGRCARLRFEASRLFNRCMNRQPYNLTSADSNHYFLAENELEEVDSILTSSRINGAGVDQQAWLVHKPANLARKPVNM